MEHACVPRLGGLVKAGRGRCSSGGLQGGGGGRRGAPGSQVFTQGLCFSGRFVLSWRDWMSLSASRGQLSGDPGRGEGGLKRAWALVVECAPASQSRQMSPWPPRDGWEKQASQ